LGFDANSLGTSIGSEGGISLYEPQPAYQQGTVTQVTPAEP